MLLASSCSLTQASAEMADDFSVDSVPVSNAPLGKFPFFGLPEGYVPQNTPRASGFGHFLFWTGKTFKDVEGQTFMETIVGVPGKKGFSSYELRKNMEALFKQAGAVKMINAKVPQESLDAITSEQRMELIDGLGDIWNNPAETWVIHRPDEAIWIHYTTSTAEASMAVVETKPFQPAAALLPPDELKADLDKTGKAVIRLNFETDKAQILPTSKPQIDAVVALLNGESTLRLAINGYTDDTGSDAHNLQLSDQRAKAVQAALVAAGIPATRLQAKGFGRLNPVSTSTDEASRAQNRRVELVKL